MWPQSRELEKNRRKMESRPTARHGDNVAPKMAKIAMWGRFRLFFPCLVFFLPLFGHVFLYLWFWGELFLSPECSQMI